MKLFFKHLCRSIRKKPLQPILITGILALAVATALFASSLGFLLRNETDRAQSERYGTSHLTVTLDGASKSRFMFVKDAEAVLGDTAEVAGVLTLPMVYGDAQTAVFGMATDFTEIGRIFDFSFTEYGALTEASVAGSAFISADFAEKNGLRCADTLLLKAFGQEKTYTVVGISPLPFLESYDVMVDNSGIASLLAGDSLLLSAVKDGFRPCSTLYIEFVSEEEKLSFWDRLFKKNEEREDPIQVDLLASAPAFKNATISMVNAAVARENNTEALSLLVDIAIVLASALAAAVTFGCLYILSTERMEENRSFMLSGACASHLHAVQYAEALSYFGVGSAIGTLCARFLLRDFVSRYAFRYASDGIRTVDAVKSILFILATVLLTVALFTAAEPMMHRAKAKMPMMRRLVPFPGLIAVLCILLAFLLPVRMRSFVILPTAVAFIVSIFVYTPIALRACAEFLDRRWETRSEKTHRAAFPSLRYAIKNIFTVKILQSSARLFALLLFVVFSVLSLMLSGFGHVSFFEKSFHADYIVFGATDKCYQGVSGCENVQSSSRVYLQMVETERGKPLMALGAEDMSAFDKGLRPNSPPRESQAAISSGEAVFSGLKVGDVLVLYVSGKRIEVVIGEILNSTLNVVLIDNEYFGLHYNLVFANGEKNATEADLLSEISTKTKTEFATVMRGEEFWNARLEAVEVYIGAGIILIAIICGFALIALLDNLLQSYRMRRDEFVLYRLSGMSRGGVGRMICAEISLSLLFGIFITLLAMLVFLPVMRAVFFSFAYDFMLGIKNFFVFM